MAGMRVIAALFDDRDDAVRAASLLHDRLALPDEAMKLGSLGAAGEPRDGRPLLAVFVPDPDLGDAHATISASGGHILDTR